MADFDKSMSETCQSTSILIGLAEYRDLQVLKVLRCRFTRSALKSFNASPHQATSEHDRASLSAFTAVQGVVITREMENV